MKTAAAKIAYSCKSSMITLHIMIAYSAEAYHHCMEQNWVIFESLHAI